MYPIEYEQAKMIRCIRIAYRIWKEFEDWLSEGKKPTEMGYVNEFGETVKSILGSFVKQGQDMRCEFWVKGQCACGGKLSPDRELPTDPQEQDAKITPVNCPAKCDEDKK